MRAGTKRIRLSERGAITWVTALMLATLALAVYLVWVWGPVWVLHYEIKTVVREYGALAIRDPDDAALRDKLVQKIASLEDEPVLLTDGTVGRQPVVQLQSQDVTWERDTSGAAPMLHVSFDYLRTIHYPLVKIDRSHSMHVDLTMDLTRPDWGPAR